MKASICFLLFRIFAYTNSIPLNTPKENNLALKVVLEVNVKENSKNVFEATNKAVIDDHKIPQLDFRALKIETFTDFIRELTNILNTYNDTAFTDFFDILDEEIRKYNYKGCKIHELTENHEFRNLMADKLHFIKRKSVPVLKADIKEVVDIIRNELYDENVKELLDYFNSLYREDAKEKFEKVLSDLKAYGNSTSERPKNYLVKIIKDGVRAIIFDHYTNLNINLRREIKKEIATFLKKNKETPSSRKTNLIPYKPKVRESVKISVNITIEDENPEHSLKTDLTSTADHNNNIFILKARDEKHQEETTKLETFNEGSNSQQLQITNLSIDESSDETKEGDSIELSQEQQREFNSHPNATLYTDDISNKNMENPEIIYKSAMSSKLVKRMLIEKPTGTLSTIQPTTAAGLRLWSDNDLRRSIPPPMPEEELSIDIFDRDKEREKKRQKSHAKNNRITTARHLMKVYIKRMRNLQNKINQLKKFDEYNQNSRRRDNVTYKSNGYKVKYAIDEYEAKDKKHKDKNKGKEHDRIKKNGSHGYCRQK